MLNLVSILIISLGVSLQSNPQTRITLTDAGKNINEQTKLIKGSDLTPDCKYPWTVRKYNNSDGLQVIDVNNGKLSFQVLPTRGMSIRQVTIGDQGPGWNSPAIGNNPASLVEVVIDRTPPCRITIRGKADEALPDGPKLQTMTEISTVPGASTFQISNTVDFAALDSKPLVSDKPTITLDDVAKSAQTWEPSFKDWYGKQAPDFTLTDITGKTQKVSDYRGKNLIVNFWATWCPPCRREIPDFIELRKNTSEDELAILGISTEDGQETKVKQFASQNKMNYTILTADLGKLAAPYSKVTAIPTTFFIDKEGKIKFATIGTLSLKDAKNILQAK